MKIKLLTDSSSTITPEQAKEHNIYLLDLHIITDDGQSFLDRPENYEKYNVLDQLAANKTFRTSQNNPGEFEKAYDECLQGNDLVIFIPCAGALSGQCKSAIQTAAQPKYKDKVLVIDNTLPGSMVKLVMFKMADMIKKGTTKKKLLDLYQEMTTDFVCAIIPGNNKTMARSGRFKKIFSSFLDIAGIKVLIL